MIGDAKSRARNAPSRAAVRLTLVVFGIAAALCVACWQNLRERQLHVAQMSVERPTARLARDAGHELMGVGLNRDRRQKTLQGAASTGNSLLRSPASAANFVIAALGAERFLEWVIRPEVPVNLHASTPTGSRGMRFFSSEPSSSDLPYPQPRVRKIWTAATGEQPLALTGSAKSGIPNDDDGGIRVLLYWSVAANALLLAWLVFVITRGRAETFRITRTSDAQSTLDAARLSGIIRSSMEAIVTIDETQRIVIFNPMAERLFRCPAADAIGEPLSRFIPERFRADHDRHVRQFGVTGGSDRQMGKQRVLFGLRADGEEFPIEASISQIDDSGGKLYTVMLHDVTERVNADAALRQSREELRELSANLQNVREEEKTRIARELHDDIGQQLTALKMDLSAIEASLDAQAAIGPQTIDQLRGMRRLVDTTVASLRRIAADQRPVMLDDLGLLPAIDWLANDFTNRYGVEVERHIETSNIEFSGRAATAVFRIVQEALTNVALHAEATRVMLTLRTDVEHCMLRIADDGRGITSPLMPLGKSFGLLGIRERAYVLGGSVSFDTPGRGGFAVSVSFPLEAVQQEESHS
ncbi:multi-sensor signal transduction histidine kinase [Caballeronia choica]|jgi:PAS domain S-box-containing protein|uniref:Multi-sensor signal transduction histidine kinase n=1 Tax=Caballeronia choica TaxID=326476 RepID=A0A158L2P7_9BURK|nr:multi-sensor signal transduction histidine kinase [Caballeronia choica]